LIHVPLNFPPSPVAWPGSLRPLFLQFDLRWLWDHLGLAVPLVLSLLFVDLFDNMGTLIGVCRRANLLDENGNLPRMGRAFAADAGAAMIGSCLGTSTVTSYIESAAGVEAGGRTGLTALVTAACFLPALFLTPLILLVPPLATAPALIIVGVLMFQGANQIPWHELHRAVPAFLVIIMMPLTFSITEGIALGLLADLAMKLGTGRRAEIPPLEYALALLFALHYIAR
jgi:AGZA family xanthine/uracil permease-like MFS transporter